MEAPPSPKPWRGRKWASDSSRTHFTDSIAADESSSQESATDYWNGASNGRFGDGIGAGTGARLGIRRAGGAMGETVYRTRSDVARMGAGGGGAGGGRAAGNGDSGGVHAGDLRHGKMDGGGGGGGLKGINGRIHRDDNGGFVGGGVGGAIDAAVNAAATAGNSGVRVGGGFECDVPTLAPVPRVGAFLHPCRLTGSGCGRKVEVRTVAFAPDPVQATRSPTSAVTASLSPPSPAAKGERGEREANGGAEGGAPPLTAGGHHVLTDGAGFAVGRQEASVEGKQWQRGEGHPESAGVRAGDVSSGAKPAGVATGHKGVVVEDSVPVAAPEKKTGRDVKTGDGARGKGSLGSGSGDRCGAASWVDVDAEAVGRMISCAPVRTHPTRAAVRQWRHMFLP